MSGGTDDFMRDNVFNGGADDFFDEDFLDRDEDGEESDNEDNYVGNDFFGGARKKKASSSSPKKADDSSKHSFSVAYVDTGSYEGGHFVSSTATNAAKKAATAIFRHIDLESGAAKPPKNAKGDTKAVKIDSRLKEKYGKRPISGVAVRFVILRKERKSLPKYYAYVAKRIKLSNPVETKKAGNRPAIKYEYKVELKADKLSAKFEAENEEFKKAYNAAKRAKKAAVEKKEKKEKKAVAPKKAVAKKTAPKKAAKGKKSSSGSSTPKKAKKVSGVDLDDIIKALSNSSSNKAVAPKRSASPKPKRATSPKPKKAAAKPKRAASPKPKKAAAKPKRAASPKPKKEAKGKKAMKGGNGFCSFF